MHNACVSVIGACDMLSRPRIISIACLSVSGACDMLRIVLMSSLMLASVILMFPSGVTPPSSDNALTLLSTYCRSLTWYLVLYCCCVCSARSSALLSVSSLLSSSLSLLLMLLFSCAES